ncbi:MAG TPA: ABC transporter permease [Puia sp.]|nr:ABC transporter permease [Puia sp.]
MKLRFFWNVLKKNKFYTVINLLGLSLGIGCWWLISMYVRDELNYDSYQKNRQLIYRMNTKVAIDGKVNLAATSSAMLGFELEKDYPEITATATFERLQKLSFRYGDLIFPEDRFFNATKNVFKIFSYQMIEGPATGALDKPNTVVLTQSIARKYFRDKEAVGQSVYINNTPYEVTGVLKDLPLNSDLYFTGLISFDPKTVDDRMLLRYYSFILVNGNSDKDPGPGHKTFIKTFNERLVHFSDSYYNHQLKSMGQNIRIDLQVQPMEGMHFDTGLLYDTPKSEKSYTYIFPVIAFFILLIVCINYMNLSIAQSSKRSREIAVKKVSGATIRQLFLQFIGESFFTVFIAFIVAACLVALAIPLFNNITGKEIELFSLLQWPIPLTLLIVYLFVGFISGIYPALYLSKLNPVSVLKSNFTQGGSRNFLRTCLIITQFVISNGMIASSIIAYNHLQFLKEKDLGFNKKGLAVLYIPDDSAVYKEMRPFKNELQQTAGIREVAFGGRGALPGGKRETSSANIETDNGNVSMLVNHAYIDDSYASLLNIQLKEGRFFDKAMATDSVETILVNETLARKVGWKNPIGKTIEYSGTRSRIIGVIKDYHYTSLHNMLEPQVIHYLTDQPNFAFIRIQPGNVGAVREIWNKYIKQYAFDCRFVDQVFEVEYTKDEKLMAIFSSFSVITIFVACIGLFGLFSITVAHRIKEIGIRKVLGGSSIGIVYLLSKAFISNMLVSILLSTPIAWFCMYSWEENFAYRENITPVIFLLSGLLSIAIALATIFFQALKAARAKPIKSLKAD